MLGSSSAISWIGSLQSFLIMFLGVLTGPLYDAGFMLPLLYTGSFLVVFGHMMLSLCHTFWQALLAQSLCVGIGAGLLFVPSIAIISAHFTTKLPLAVGIAASGSHVSLSGPVLVLLSPHARVVSTRMGMCFTLLGVALLIGTPISGATLDTDTNAVWVYSGVSTLLGGVVVGVARVSKTSWNIIAKC